MPKSSPISPVPPKSTVGNNSVLRSALAMSTGTLSSRILGLLRDIFVTAFFPKTVTDTFFAAFKLPNLFRRLLGEGSLSVSFIPVYVDLNHTHGEDSAKKLSGSLWSLLLLLTASLSVLGVLFMDKLIPLYLGGEGFASVPGKLELATTLAKIMFSYLFLVTSYAFLMAVANAHRYFLVPSMGPTLFNAIFIITTLLSYYFNVLSGHWIAIGVLVGGALQTLLVLFFLLRKELLPKLVWNLKAPGLARVLRNMIPGMLGLGIVQIMSLINIRYASELPEGAISYIYIGDRILELPQSLIAISLGSALLPTLSKLWSEGNKLGFLQESLKYQKIILYMALPCCVGMYVLAQPIVQVLFQRGEVGLSDVLQIVVVLEVYSFLLLASSLNKILVPNLYAIKNTWLPAVITVVSLTVHIVLAPFLLDSMGLRGLILSMTIAGFLNMTLVLISCQILVGRTSLFQLSHSFVKSLGLSLAMGAVVYYGYHSLADTLMNAPLTRALGLFLLIGLGVLVYGLLSYLFKIEELGIVKKLLKKS